MSFASLRNELTIDSDLANPSNLPLHRLFQGTWLKKSWHLGFSVARGCGTFKKIEIILKFIVTLPCESQERLARPIKKWTYFFEKVGALIGGAPWVGIA
jgi:hypothetical protein